MSTKQRIRQVIDELPESVSLEEAIERLYAAFKMKQAMTHEREMHLRRLLEEEIWPEVPKEQRGRRLSRDEGEAILGIGREGV